MIVAVLSVLLAGASASVMELSDKDYAVAELPLLLNLYAPWCGHCRQFESQFAAAAEALAPLHFARLDIAANPQAAKAFGVTGVPTVLLLRNDTRIEYTGAYEAPALVKWVRHKTESPVATLESPQAVADFLAANPVAAVLFDNQTSDCYAHFLQVAQAAEDHFFAVSTAPDSLDKYEAQASNIVVFKPFDDKRVLFNDTCSLESVQSFITRAQTPWVSPWNDTVISYVYKHHFPVVLVFYPYNRNNYYRAVMQEIAPAIKDDIVFAYMDLETGDGYKLAEFLGIRTSAQPTAMVLESDGQRVLKYLFHAESLNKETLREFVDLWKAEQLAPYFKTEAPVADLHKGVRTLTGTDFSTVLATATTDVIVLFYVPWSTECLEALKVLQSANSTALLASINMHLNDLSEEEITQFPTLRRYSEGGTLAATFQGEWTEAAIRNFAAIQ